VPDLPESRVLRLNRLYPRSIVKSQVGTLLVPRPHAQTTGGSTGQATGQTTGRSTARSAAQVLGGRPIDGVALLEWARTVIDTVIDPDRAPSSPTSTTSRESS